MNSSLGEKYGRSREMNEKPCRVRDSIAQNSFNIRRLMQIS